MKNIFLEELIALSLFINCFRSKKNLNVYIKNRTHRCEKNAEENKNEISLLANWKSIFYKMGQILWLKHVLNMLARWLVFQLERIPRQLVFFARSLLLFILFSLLKLKTLYNVKLFMGLSAIAGTLSGCSCVERMWVEIL